MEKFEKRCFHSEIASNVLRPHQAGNTRAGKSRDYCDVIVVFKLFSVHTKTQSKASIFKFHRFEESFRKAPFS